MTRNGSGPLAGVRIVEFVGVGPGPFAAMWFADMGAEVVRIDRPGQRWNQTRGDVLNRGRRSMALDLKKEGAVEVALRMIESADVLLEGFRPGVMERLGLGPRECLARNPRLIYGRITGWGQDGPRKMQAGHDINYVAATGLLGTVGTAEHGPVPPLNLVGDFGGGGMMLVAGVLAALVERSGSGQGQVVDAAMSEGASLLGGMIWAYHNKGLWAEERESNIFDGGAPYYRCYQCRDGEYVALGAIEEAFWQEFLDLCGIDDELVKSSRKDRGKWPEVRARLEQIFLTRDAAEWCAMTEGSDACLSMVLGFDDAAKDPHAIARGAFVEVAGATQPAPAPRFERTPGRVSAPPPFVGEHTRGVLADFGFSTEEIELLEAAGTVRHEDGASASGSPGPLG